ncbi:hypothetical protein Zmor_002976 [Zophobas morio]|uniref:Uncharacterized protein n=1 Tax=Zophobas morio TaxID=2755281 RepID=A0AA38HR86_9CUCU|nr:hypothetical protein Zmor_002976 [Zophobas morio]
MFPITHRSCLPFFPSLNYSTSALTRRNNFWRRSFLLERIFKNCHKKTERKSGRSRRPAFAGARPLSNGAAKRRQAELPASNAGG